MTPETEITAEQIADFIIGFSNKSGELITNLKLQKLLYYAQAWHLANKHRSLFKEDFEAWVHGPVIPSIYHQFKSFSPSPILKEVDLDAIKKLLGAETVAYMEELLSVYLPFSAYELERMTHEEDPWKTTRGGLETSERCEVKIPTGLIEAYYASRITAQSEK